MLGVGALMILYVGAAVLGLVSSSARHYSTFMLFVMIMLIVQWTSSVFLYGYFRRKLTTAERSAFFVAVMLGYTALMRSEPLYTYLALGSTAALAAWLWARSARLAWT